MCVFYRDGSYTETGFTAALFPQRDRKHSDRPPSDPSGPVKTRRRGCGFQRRCVRYKGSLPLWAPRYSYIYFCDSCKCFLCFFFLLLIDWCVTFSQNSPGRGSAQGAGLKA